MSHWKVDPVGGATTELDVAAIRAVGSMPIRCEPED